MFEMRVAEIIWKVGYDISCGFEGCKEFIDAWKWLATLGLSEHRINEVYPDGRLAIYRSPAVFWANIETQWKKNNNWNLNWLNHVN